ncbi:MAG: RecQ family ATP-dependent DNA helicase [Saprospiraceae bacterium]|nr:RecQ family ATP-dependent DNA helicase [Saprospiraceae bacterium]
MTTVDKARTYLSRYWGHGDFRPMQGDIISSILDGRDTVALLPTGGGKSVCFQIPALMLEGLTLVISPLIALMNDQVASLKANGIKAGCIHSNLHYKEIERLLDTAQYGHLKLLYISPERLQSRDFVLRLDALPISLLVIDEAHCVSMWGYDFRPSYLEITEVRNRLPAVATIALTATATPQVLVDIVGKLGMKDASIFRQSFLRPNLKFGVLKVEDKRAKVLKLAKTIIGVKIIYVRTRRGTKDLSTLLLRNGLKAQHYHAGLSVEERDAHEQAFINGKIDVMVATNAFGMGIDKADVRLVVHCDVPENLEAYYQEAGRAGRDGVESYAILLYQASDLKRLWHQFEQSFPTFKEIRRVYQALGNFLRLAVGSGAGETYDFDLLNFAKQYRFDMRSAWSALKVMEQSGWFVLSEGVFKPATLRVIVDREVLYDYQLRNRQKEPLIQALLRLYQGILQDLVPIRLQQLSSFLNIPIVAVQQNLSELQQDGILEYFPKNDTGRIMLIHPRTTSENLTIDESLLNFRKERRKEGIDSMLRYIDVASCRQKYLSTYFGEKNPVDCGICDNCRKKRGTAKTKKKLPNLKQAILQKLGSSPASIKELCDAFTKHSDFEILDALQWLVDEEMVFRSEQLISLSNINE